MKLLYIPLGLVLIASTFYFVLGSDAQATTFVPIVAGSTQSGDVAIELTPRGFTDGMLVVDISANTHSVDLSQFNLTEITTLRYGQADIAPAQASVLSGHHTSGKLTFAVPHERSEFTIIIDGIPEKRVFDWR